MKHLKENNETYLSHLRFAGTIGFQLILHGVALVVHGLFPFIAQPIFLTLAQTQVLVNKGMDRTSSRVNNNNES
jgi:hypothetical protein|tara:strand:- start:984 stop:1205 length:222 start_codon:yes stop_codon:yes gene_type:complete